MDEIVETVIEPSSGGSRQRTMVIAILALLVVVVVLLLLRGCGSGSSSTTGDVASPAVGTRDFTLAVGLNPLGYDVDRYIVFSGTTCSGTGSHTGLTGGAVVIARDSQGKELSRSTLADGVRYESRVGTPACKFQLTALLKVPEGTDIVVEIPGFGDPEVFTAQELERSGYSVGSFSSGG